MIEEELLKKLPKELVTTINLYHTVDGHAINYQIQFTVFGEVLSVENDFDELPDTAKKLIFGNKNLDEISNKLLRYEQIKYIIPIIAVGGMNLLPEWLPPVVATLQKMQKQLPAPIKENPNPYISFPWIIELIERAKSLKPEQSIVSIHFERVLLKKSLGLNTQMIQADEMHLAIPILIEILESNLHDDQLVPAIIRGLKGSNNERAYELILKIFSSHKYSKVSWKAAQVALKEMSENRNVPTLYDALWSEDHKKRLLSVETLAAYVDEEEVESMLMRVLKYDDDYKVRAKAIEALSSKRNNSQLLEYLTELMKSGFDNNVRYAAVQALKRMNNDAARAVLKEYHY